MINYQHGDLVTREGMDRWTNYKDGLEAQATTFEERGQAAVVFSVFNHIYLHTLLPSDHENRVHAMSYSLATLETPPGVLYGNLVESDPVGELIHDAWSRPASDISVNFRINQLSQRFRRREMTEAEYYQILERKHPDVETALTWEWETC